MWTSRPCQSVARWTSMASATATTSSAEPAGSCVLMGQQPFYL